jgi:hypothetical protein
MKENIIRKLTSRKFWAAVVGFVTAVITVFNIDYITPEQSEILIMGFATLVAYILGEGFTDAMNSKNKPTEGVGEDA